MISAPVSSGKAPLSRVHLPPLCVNIHTHNSPKPVSPSQKSRGPTNNFFIEAQTRKSTGVTHKHKDPNFKNPFDGIPSRENPCIIGDEFLSETPPASQLKECQQLAHLLQRSSNLDEVKQIHAVVTKCYGYSLSFMDNNLICAYANCGDLFAARKVFDKMASRNIVSWTAMLNWYLKYGLDSELTSLYLQFVQTGLPWNSKTFVCMLNMCCRKVDFDLGKQIHARILKSRCKGLILDTAVMHFYVQCMDAEAAFRVFDRIEERDVVSWTTLIAACSKYGRAKDAFFMFSDMLTSGFQPNEFTVCSVLNACGKEKDLRFGRQLHGAIAKKIYKMDVFVGTSLVDMYAKCGEIRDSALVFDGIRKKNTVTWTSMIAGYARNGFAEEAIGIYRMMKRQKIFANSLTTVSILRACGLLGALSAGKEVHAQVIKNHIQNNMYLGSALVWLYCKCGEYTAASRVLQDMPIRDVISWTAMISGCVSLGHEHEALEYLKEMLDEGVIPNPYTFSSALKACARLEDVKQGKLIHSSINKSPALSNVFVGSTLINMYAKCGHLPEAIQVFDSMPEHNLVSRKAMIVAYAKNGLCEEALKLMYHMQAEGIEVDDYIFSTVLTACGDLSYDAESKPLHFWQSSGAFV